MFTVNVCSFERMFFAKEHMFFFLLLSFDKEHMFVEEEQNERMFFLTTTEEQKNICSFERMFFLTTVEEERLDEEGRSDEEEHKFAFTCGGGTLDEETPHKKR